MDLPVPGSDVKAHWLSDLRLSFLCQSQTSGGRGVRDEDVKVTFSGTCCVYDAFWFRYFCSGRWVHYKTKDIMRERREIVVLCEK